jgi:death-on-curing protein
LLIAKATGGAIGIRAFGSLESAIAQPKATFDGKDLYPSIIEKAAVLCFSIVQSHPFVDGNKRAGHAAMAAFLFLNGSEINATIEEQEHIMLTLASGQMKLNESTAWLKEHVKGLSDSGGA